MAPISCCLLRPLLLGLALTTANAFGQATDIVHQYLTTEEALEEVFPDATHHLKETIHLSTDADDSVNAVAGAVAGNMVYEVILSFDRSDAFLGYAVVTEEVGKYRPITFIVGIRPNLEVEKVAIMTYREDRGGEVRTPRFLYQYRGKDASDPIRTNKDIINISGATLSVRAVNEGVRKVLRAVTQAFRGRPLIDYETKRKQLVSTTDG